MSLFFGFNFTGRKLFLPLSSFSFFLRFEIFEQPKMIKVSHRGQAKIRNGHHSSSVRKPGYHYMLENPRCYKGRTEFLIIKKTQMIITFWDRPGKNSTKSIMITKKSRKSQTRAKMFTTDAFVSPLFFS